MKNSLIQNHKKQLSLYYIGIGALFLFLHFFRLSSVPYGLHVDEAAMAYDAFCIANYGVSRHLIPLPVYLINFGGGQSALYAYITAFFMRLFGTGTFVIRLPAALFSVLTLIFGTRILKENLSRRAAALGAGLLTVLPYFIMQARFGLDCNLFLGASTVSLYALIAAAKKQTCPAYALAGLAFGLTLYSYALSYLIIPVFLAAAALYLLHVRKINLKMLCSLLFALLLVAWPLIAFVAVNSFGLPSFSFLGFTIPQMPDFRAGEFSLSYFSENIRRIFPIAFTWDGLYHNALPGFYTMYILSIPFAVAGFGFAAAKLFRSMKRRSFSATALIPLLLFANFSVCLFLGGDGGNANVNKMNGIYFCLLFCTVLGITRFVRAVRGIKWASAALLAAYLVNFVWFGFYYFITYPADFPQPFFILRPENTLKYLEENVPEGTDVYLEIPAFIYALEEKISPYDINVRGKPEQTADFGNYHFMYILDEAVPGEVYVPANGGYIEMSVLLAKYEAFPTHREEYRIYFY